MKPLIAWAVVVKKNGEDEIASIIFDRDSAEDSAGFLEDLQVKTEIKKVRIEIIE